MKKGDQVRTNAKTSVREEGELIEVIPPKAKYDVTVAKVQTERGVIRANVDYLERVD
jgi:hypothetical protein